MKLGAIVLVLLAGPGFQGANFRIQGLCSIDDRGVACWDEAGLDQPKLAAQVQARVAASDVPLSFVPGRKNRYAVVAYDGVEWLSPSSPSGPVQSYAYGSSSGESVHLFRIAAGTTAKTSVLTLVFGLSQGKSVEVPLREGMGARVDGVPIKFGRIEEHPEDPPGGFRGYSGPGPFLWGRWRFPIEHGRLGPGDRFRLEAIGRNGKPIRFVDARGVPVDDKVGEAYWKELRRPGYGWTGSPSIFYASLEVTDLAPNGWSSLFWVGTQINPTLISRVRVWHIVGHQETLGPFTLDPIQASGP